MLRKVNKINCLAVTNPELLRQWHPRNKLKPTEVTTGSNKKVWWKCGYGHEWEAVIAKRTAGRGCPYCAGKKVDISTCLATKNPTLALQWHPTKNGKLKPTQVTTRSGKRVWWQCPFKHSWQSSIANRSKSGCPYCANKAVNRSNCLQTTNPELAKEWHPTKNGKLKPTQVTAHSHKQVWWQCKKEHDWKATVDKRSKSGCPYCANKAINESNCLQTTNPELAKEWHPTKNGKLKPTQVTTGSGKRVWWQCPLGHEHYTRIQHRANGIGCVKCSTIDRTHNTSEFISVVEKIHSGKYDYSNVEYENTRKKINIICPIHGLFMQLPRSHLSGHGCKKCADQKIVHTSTLSPELQERFDAIMTGSFGHQLRKLVCE